MTKHLYTLLPFLLAVENVPAALPQRIGLLQGVARDIANDAEFAKDWYEALELLSGEDLSSKSVAELLLLAVTLMKQPRLASVWQTAFSIGLLDEDTVRYWILYEGAVDGRSVSS